MKSSVKLKMAITGLICLAGGSMLSAQINTDQEFWNKPYIRKAFLGSYELNTKLEPTLTEEEQVIVKQIFDLLTANPNSATAKEQALNMLLPHIKPDATAAFDFIAANFYAEKGDMKNAIKFYEQSVQKFEYFMRAIKNLALMQVREGKYEAAITNFTKAIGLGANDTNTMGLLGLCYVNTERYFSAETAYRQAIVLEPTIKDWQLGLAKSLLNQQKWKEAIAVLDQLLLDDPDNDLLWISEANAYLGLDDPETSVAIQEIVDRLGKSTPESLMFMGNIYMSRGLNDLALDYFQRAIKMDPKQKAEAHVDIAEVMTARGAYEQAKVEINMIKTTFKDNLTDEDKLRLLRLQAQIALAERRGEEVIPILQELIERDPLDGQALLLLAEFYSNKGDTDSYSQADIYFERATKIRDWETRALLAWARSYVSREKYDKAIPLLERLMVLEPQEYIGRYLDQVRKVHLAKLGLQ